VAVLAQPITGSLCKNDDSTYGIAGPCTRGGRKVATMILVGQYDSPYVRRVTTEDLPSGVKLLVTSADPQTALKIWGLGFLDIMVQGGHHQPHHLAMAKGEFDMHRHRDDIP